MRKELARGNQKITKSRIMNQEQYVQLVAQSYNQFYHKEVLATPNSFKCLPQTSKGKNSYFFESVQEVKNGALHNRSSVQNYIR